MASVNICGVEEDFWRRLVPGRGLAPAQRGSGSAGNRGAIGMACRADYLFLERQQIVPVFDCWLVKAEVLFMG